MKNPEDFKNNSNEQATTVPVGTRAQIGGSTVPEDFIFTDQDESVPSVSLETRTHIDTSFERATFIFDVTLTASDAMDDEDLVQLREYFEVIHGLYGQLKTLKDELLDDSTRRSPEVLNSMMKEFNDKAAHLEVVYGLLEGELDTLGYEISTTEVVMESKDETKAGEALTPESAQVAIPAAPIESFNHSHATETIPASEAGDPSRQMHGAEAKIDQDVESEVMNDIAFYRQWQNGTDPSAIFTKIEWKNHVPKIEHDIRLSLKAAGYSKAEIHTHMRSLWPLLKKATHQAEHQTRNLHELRMQLLKRVSGLLAGREPDPEVFRRRYISSEYSDNVTDDEAYTIFNQLPDYSSVELYDGPLSGHDTLPDQMGMIDNIEDSGATTVSTEESVDGVSLVSPELRERYTSVRDSLRERGVSLENVPAIRQIENALGAIAALQSEHDEMVRKIRLQIYEAKIAKLLDVLADRGAIPTTAETVIIPQVRDGDSNENVTTTPTIVSGEGQSIPASSGESGVATTERDTLRTSVLETRREMGKVLRESKREMRELETQYNESLRNYYRNRSLGQKLRDGLRQFRGREDGYSPELRELQKRYDQAADTYRTALREKLELRARTQADTAGAAAYEGAIDDRLAIKGQRTVVGTDGVTRVFGVESEADIRAAAIETADRESRLNTVLSTMRANPKVTRAIGLGLAAGVGALSGGIPTALAASARWAVATFGGAAAAEFMYRRSQKEVDAAASALEYVRENDVDGISVTDRRKALRLNEALVRKAKVRQRSKAVLTAVAVGGAASYGAATVNEYLNSDVPVAGPLGSGTSVSATSEGVEIIAGPVIQVKEVAVEGTMLGDQLVKNIELLSSNANAVIPEAEVPGIFGYVKLATQDIVAAHPNMAVDDVERLLLEKLTNKYGATEWWQQAKVTKVEIAGIELSGTTSGAETVETYTVRPGDSIWRIATREHSDVLAELNATERDQVLVELRERINESPALQQEIGVTSGNADQIEVGDSINLSEMEEELRDIIADRPKRGALPVQGDLSEQSVPIRSTYTTPVDPQEFGVPVEAPRYNSIDPMAPKLPVNQDPMFIVPGKDTVIAGTAEAVAPAVSELPKLPTVEPLAGSYLTTPEYQDFIARNFGSEAVFSRTVDQAATRFEDGTYDFINRFLQEFKSPFKATPQELLENRDFELAKMTVAEIREWRAGFENDPELLRSFALQNGFKYETLKAWLEKVDVLTDTRTGLPFKESTTFGDLYARSIAKELVELKAGQILQANK